MFKVLYTDKSQLVNNLVADVFKIQSDVESNNYHTELVNNLNLDSLLS